MTEIIEVLKGFAMESGIAQFFEAGGWKNLVMIGISCVLIYLAIGRKFEPLLLLPIAFGMLLTNLPISGLMHMEYFNDGTVNMGEIIAHGGLFDWLYLGVKFGIYPPLIFLGAHGPKDRLHRSPPRTCSASRSQRSFLPDRDNTFQRFRDKAEIPL